MGWTIDRRADIANHHMSDPTRNKLSSLLIMKSYIKEQNKNRAKQP